MAVLRDKEIVDLTTSTLDDLGPPRFSQIAQDFSRYEVMGKWFKRDKVVFDTGVGIQRLVMNVLPDSAKHVGLYEIDNVNVQDLLAKLTIPWRHATTNWAYERREVLMNRGKALVVNVIEPRRAGALIKLASVLENKGWAAPTSSSDELDPFGLPYWITANATTGFNGAAPSGHTAVGGITPSSTNGWQNYTAQYTNITKGDAIKKLRTAHRKINWISPVTIKDLRGSLGQQLRVYVNETVISDIEDLGEEQNDNLGADVASMDGTMVFRKHPIVYVPKLDDSTKKPFYLVDHKTFMPVVLKGDFLRETRPEKAAGQHNVFVVHVDITYNYLCIDRRRNARLEIA